MFGSVMPLKSWRGGKGDSKDMESQIGISCFIFFFFFSLHFLSAWCFLAFRHRSGVRHLLGGI